MSPYLRQAWASRIVPVSTIMRAVERLVTRGKSQVTPQSGLKPRRTMAADMRALGSAKRRSQASAKARPAPMAGPLMAAITGFSTSTIVFTNSAKGPAGVFF